MGAAGRWLNFVAGDVGKISPYQPRLSLSLSLPKIAPRSAVFASPTQQPNKRKYRDVAESRLLLKRAEVRNKDFN